MLKMRTLGPVLAVLSILSVSCGGNKLEPDGNEPGNTGVYSISPSSVNLSVGETTPLEVLVNQETVYTGSDVEWSSSSSGVASVSSSGVVMGVSEGNTRIYAKVKGKTASCTVTVKAKTAPAESISLDCYSHQMNIGDEFGLKAEVHPEGASQKVNWLSLDKKVATVSANGVVTALEEGQTSIYAQSGDVLSEPCVITVKNPAGTKEDTAANCHMVAPGGTIIFPANRGNTSSPIRDIVGTEVLWESFCRATNEKAKVGDVIKSVTYADGKVTVKTTGHDGNAVVAVLNDLGVILWSWHIWVTDYTADVNKGELDWYDGAYVFLMDRNLGALSNEPAKLEALGLYYQWGRKDPFYSSEWGSSRSLVYVSEKRSWDGKANSSIADLDYSIAHPMTGIERTGTGEWLPTTISTLWNDSKGVYDPCPPGYRVPSGGSDGFFSNSWVNLDYTNNYVWVEGKYYVPNIYQEMSGYRFVINNNRETAYWPDGWGMTAGTFYKQSGYWSCTQHSTMTDNAYTLYLKKDRVSELGAMKREWLSVRCQLM